MIPLDQLEGAARGNPQLRALLRALVQQSNLQAANLGADPTAAQQAKKQQFVPVPGLAEMTVVGESGTFSIALFNPADANGPILHELQSSSTLPFSTSDDVEVYEASPATTRTIVAPGETWYWRWRSKYANSSFNHWQQLPEAIAAGESGGVVMSVTATPPLASSGGTTPNISIILPADATKYLDGTGVFTVPAGGGTSPTYTPAHTNLTNCTTTPRLTTYIHVANGVIVFGEFDVDPTAAAVVTSFEMSLPVASNFANTFECGGSGAGDSQAGYSVKISGNVANNTAFVSWISSDISAQTISFCFGYRVI